MGDILGYARVSTDDQDLEGQRRRLKKAGAIRIFEDVMSGKRFERPGLTQLLDYARPNDCLCVVRLDRLGRSLPELLEVLDLLSLRSAASTSSRSRRRSTPPRPPESCSSTSSAPSPTSSGVSLGSAPRTVLLRQRPRGAGPVDHPSTPTSEMQP
jgi:hypothetical protein